MDYSEIWDAMVEAEAAGDIEAAEIYQSMLDALAEEM